MNQFSIGQVVEIYKRSEKGKLKSKGRFSITGLYQRFILFENRHYKISIQILALRSREYVLRVPNGSTIKFKPLASKIDNKRATAKSAERMGKSAVS